VSLKPGNKHFKRKDIARQIQKKSDKYPLIRRAKYGLTLLNETPDAIIIIH
jgi:hypothetical protein